MAVRGTIIDTILEDADGHTTGIHDRQSHISVLSPYIPDIFVHCYERFPGSYPSTQGVSTVRVNEDGTIDSIIDASSILYRSDGDTAFAKIRDNVFATLYRSRGSPGPGNFDLSTIVINDDGTHGAINYRGVSAGDNHYPALCGTPDGYAITAYHYNILPHRVWIKTWKIGADGSIAAAATDTETILIDAFRYIAWVEHVRGDIYCISYRSYITGANTDRLTTFSVVNGMITVLDTVDFGAIVGEASVTNTAIAALSSPEGRCLVAYTGVPFNRGRVVTLDIDAAGNIGAMIDKYNVHGGTNCFDFHVHGITPNIFGVSYFDSSYNYGYVDVGQCRSLTG